MTPAEFEAQLQSDIAEFYDEDPQRELGQIRVVSNEGLEVRCDSVAHECLSEFVVVVATWSVEARRRPTRAAVERR